MTREAIEGLDPVDQAVATAGDPVEAVESQSELDEYLARLELPRSAAGTHRARLTSRQYRKRIEKAWQALSS